MIFKSPIRSGLLSLHDDKNSKMQFITTFVHQHQLLNKKVVKIWLFIVYLYHEINIKNEYNVLFNLFLSISRRNVCWRHMYNTVCMFESRILAYHFIKKNIKHSHSIALNDIAQYRIQLIRLYGIIPDIFSQAWSSLLILNYLFLVVVSNEIGSSSSRSLEPLM